MKLTSYSIEKPIKGLTKSYGIWGKGEGTNSISPLAYLQRPKWITDDNIWNEIVNAIRLDLPQNFEIK